MKFDFKPEQVSNGKVIYTFSDFRRDLRQEVETYVKKKRPQETAENQEIMVSSLLNLQFDVYYWTAMDNDLEDLVNFFKEKDPATAVDLEFLRALQEEGIEAIKMLAAILNKKVRDFQKEGLSEESARDKLASYIQECLEKEPQ
jgi:hypothetical protein